MADKERAKKIAAAKKKLKAYKSGEKNLPQQTKDINNKQEVPNLQNYFLSNSSGQDNFLEQQPDKSLENSQKFKVEPGSTMKISNTSDFEKLSNIQQQIAENVSAKPQQFIIEAGTDLKNYADSPKIPHPHLQEIPKSVVNENNQNMSCESITFSTNNIPVQNNFGLSPPNHITEKISTSEVLIPLESHEKYNNSLQSSSASSVELLKTIEVLISDKAQLSKENSRLQISCKEKDYELEEIKTRFEGANKRIEELEQYFFNEQHKSKELSERIQDLELELKKYHQQAEEQNEHILELKRELTVDKTKITELEKEVKEKVNQLELNNSRLNQMSDENKINIDNRVETLTQTKFLYEQQISELQNLVQMLQTEKDQASQQYQNYVQHLNKDLTAIQDKNAEVIEENAKLARREQELVDHISKLEKDIQQNIIKNQNLRENMKNSPSATAVTSLEQEELKLKVDELKHSEIALKKIIEEKNEIIVKKEHLIEEKTFEINTLLERISHLEEQTPDHAKLLASIESDKVAASRAMTQNSELRKQLDELQLKLIELTNDKMDLTNSLDAEKYSSKQIRQNYDEMNIQIKTLSDQLHFKDEEMIRLSHENNELTDEIVKLQKKILEKKSHKEKWRQPNNTESSDNVSMQSNNDGNEEQDKAQSEDCCDHEMEHKENNSKECPFDKTQIDNNQTVSNLTSIKRKDSDSISLPSSEAMVRLEERFKKLMGEVAELTDEKQQLEHLVLQLQGETETIGEYIALYQSQRKILKQKEYERDSQLRRLLAEREDLRNKALQLEALIKEIGIKTNEVQHLNLDDYINKQKEIVQKAAKNLLNGHHNDKNENIETAQKENVMQSDSNNLENTKTKLNVCDISESDSQKIIERINSLVADLKCNNDSFPLATDSVDHCACCSGNLETI